MGTEASAHAAAVLPRGIGFNYSGSDHHLLQLAWNLHSAEPFARDQIYNKGETYIVQSLVCIYGNNLIL